ncbi:MAG TPA: hypothetical protein VMF52_11310 [Steroidobacteraceae bacterium]|nr:hypothetical protein [Steroidobacteraceae bacterium]
MAAAAPSFLPLLVFVPLFLWRMYSRIKRNIGRQKFVTWRPWVTLTLFPVLLILIGMGSLPHPERLLAMAGGLIAGAVLGVFGTKHTKFENTPEGIFYTPNAHIGIALSVIFLGRMAYRMWQLYSMDPTAQPNPADFASSPLTLSIFGLLAGYYMTYAVGLIRYRMTDEREKSRQVP